MIYTIAHPEDVDAICKLIEDAIIEMETHEIYQWDNIYPTRDDFLEDIAKGSLYLAIEDSNIVAIYVISREADAAYNKVKWSVSDEKAYILHRFCVSPAFQNRGIGKNVLLHIEEQIKGMGYESVRLDVFTQNPYAQKLYRNNGYVTRGHADWRKGRFDLMEKIL